MTLINAEQQAKIRQYRYTAAAVIATAGPALAIALAEGGVSKWIAFATLFTTALTGAAGSAVAASKTRTQRADGMFDQPADVPDQPAPPPPALDDVAITAVQQVIADATNAAAVRDRVAQGVTEAFGGIVGGGVTAVAGPVVGSVAESLAEQTVRSVLLPRI